jgi:hypothetical protein
MTDEELIQMLEAATRFACTGLAGSGLAALQASLDQACAVPAGFSWERKAAAHAEFLNALADVSTDPRLARVLSGGAGLAYDVMITAGCAADGIVINSRKWMLAHLHAGDVDAAAYEMVSHLRILHFMSRLAVPRIQSEHRDDAPEVVTAGRDAKIGIGVGAATGPRQHPSPRRSRRQADWRNRSLTLVKLSALLFRRGEGGTCHQPRRQGGHNGTKRATDARFCLLRASESGFPDRHARNDRDPPSSCRFTVFCPCRLASSGRDGSPGRLS